MDFHPNPVRARITATTMIAAVTTIALGMTAASSAARSVKPPPPTVKISGKAYRFNHMDTPLPGATIKVREFPKLQATTAADGDYVLKVPDDRNVTPYIVSGSIPPGTDPGSQHYNEIDLQTFHPRGKDLVNANFQVPTDLEYGGLKALLNVPADENGRPEQCAIVTTASDRDVRGVDYQTFWDRTKLDENGVHGHGVPGATSIGVPSLGAPTYFNDNVIPDKTKTATSSDGGIIWEIVPAGSYRIITSHPDKRFASFLATCEDGRVVNANPPWGAYELAQGERPLAASNVAGNVTKVKAARQGKRKRYLAITVRTAEPLVLRATLLKGKPVIERVNKRKVGPGTTVVRFPIKRRVPAGIGKVRYSLADATGIDFGGAETVLVPKLPGRR